MPTLTKKNIRDSGSTAPTSGDTDLPLPVQQSVSYADHRRLNQKFELGTAIRDVWATFRKRIGTGTAPSNGTDHADNHEDANPSLHISEGVDLKHPEVDQVVVDRTWTAEAKDSSTGSEYEMSPDKSGATPPVPGSAVPEQESAVVTHGHWSLPWIIIRYRFWPAVLNFFYPTSYINEDGERHYKQVRYTSTSSKCFSMCLYNCIGRLVPQQESSTMGVTLAGRQLGPWLWVCPKALPARR